MNPRTFTDLRVWGFLDVLADKRVRPSVVSALLLDPSTREVFLPPFNVADGQLQSAGETRTLTELEASVARGEATATTHRPPARLDACFYAPRGSGSPEFVSHTEAVRRLLEFAGEQSRQGDRLFARGDRGGALGFYEQAAATAHRPDDYARMLLVIPESSQRYSRVWKLLCDVARSPTNDLARVREDLKQQPIFGSSARATARLLVPLPATA